MRISAHNLAIETGRYAKPIATPANKRLCFHCKEIENEFHFLFNCSLYNSERENFYEELANILAIPLLPTNDFFLLLMSSLGGDLEVGRIICNFINVCFKIRSDMLCTKREMDILLRPCTTITRTGRISKRPSILDL